MVWLCLEYFVLAKRSEFDRIPRDFYPTPIEAVYPLYKYLEGSSKRFVEPCAGDGRLVRHIERMGHQCIYKADIEPMADDINKSDALFFNNGYPECDLIITNPPWTREILHPMIDVFIAHAPTWLLFDAGWMFTEQARPYLIHCKCIVAIPRVKWIEGSEHGAMDDCCWYLFDRSWSSGTVFIGR